MQVSPVSCHASLFGLNILLNDPFSNALNLGSLLNVRDQVSHPHKTSKIRILNILIFTFLDGKPEEKIF
jgi:hypothetical protein